MYARLIAFSVAVLFSLLAWAGPASAGITTDQWSDGTGVGASTGTNNDNVGTSGGNGSGNAAAPVCTYNLLTGDDATSAEQFSQTGWGPTKGAEPGAWYREICTDATGGTTGIIMWIVQAVDPVALAQQALDYTALSAPQLALNPPANQVQLVNLPVWLAVAGGTWKPASASASAGNTTVTTTATPTKVTWNMGDGNTVTCGGPGAIYNPSLPDTAQHSDCTYTYTNSSAGKPNNTFTITATEEWHVTWTAAGAPPGTPGAGDLGAITRTSTAAVQVGEIQALNQEH